MLTTKEAAERLGVSTGRVRQLVCEGRLTAQKTRQGWLISEACVEQRKHSVKPGRPMLGSEEQQLSMFTLMQADNPVAHVVYSGAKDMFTQVALVDRTRAPFVLRGTRGADSGLLQLFNEWWTRRCVPSCRLGVDTLLAEEQAPSPGFLAQCGSAASLTDQYWLKPRGSRKTWGSVDFRVRGLPERARGGSAWLGPWTKSSPDITTSGSLSKCWLVDGEGKVVLVKAGGLDGREALSEIIATRLYRRLLRAGEYVEYRLAHWDEQLVSACQSFVGFQETFVDAWSLCYSATRIPGKGMYGHYYERCEDLSVPSAMDMVDKMLVTDYLLANPCRTWQDFGVVENTSTRHMRPAPLFDAGAALWSRVPAERLEDAIASCAGTPFDTNQERQLELVVDARWLHPDALDDFVDEMHSIMMNVLSDPGVVAELVCTGVAQRIQRVKSWYAKMPHPVVVGWENPDTSKTVEYVTL